MTVVAVSVGQILAFVLQTSQLTDTIGENTRENQKRMDDATSNMEQIHRSTAECKEIITKLGEESKEIIGIIETITSISNKTNILALNASIEAARAGEHGKGFIASSNEELSAQIHQRPSWSKAEILELRWHV